MQPGPLDRARVGTGDAHAAALVEAQRVEVVVGGDEPHTAHAGPHGNLASRLEQRGADTLATRRCVDSDDFQPRRVYLICEQTDRIAINFGDQCG
ncbi:hypothetical protein GCM10010399_20540 [Dactylosporangium fulvum]